MGCKKKLILAVISGDTADLVVNDKLELYAKPSGNLSVKNIFLDRTNMSELKKIIFCHKAKIC